MSTQGTPVPVIQGRNSFELENATIMFNVNGMPPEVPARKAGQAA